MPEQGPGVASPAFVSFSPNVNCDELLARELAEVDALNCRLVDGRAIHHYLHFIDAPLRAMHLIEDWHGDLPSRLARRMLELAWCTFPDTAVLSLDETVQIKVFVERDGERSTLGAPPPTVLESVRAALAALGRVGLAFFVELTAGAIVLTAGDREPPIPFVLTVPWSELDEAGILRRAASELMHQYVEAELSLHDPALCSRAGRERYAERAREFGRSVDAERYRRAVQARQPYVSPAERDRLLAALGREFAQAPHARELFCCWYPCWNRSLFIFNSPFDGLETLTRTRGSS